MKLKTIIQQFATVFLLSILFYGIASAQGGTPLGGPQYGYSQPASSDFLLQTGGFI